MAASSGEGTINIAKPIQIPAWVFAVGLLGGGGWLTYQQAQGAETTQAIQNCNELDGVKEDVAALKAQRDLIAGQLARLDAAIVVCAIIDPETGPL